jgi:excisionase family DNA binding protein
MDIGQLSEFLSVKQATIRRWVAQRSIPYTKMGKLVRFNKVEIEAWASAKAVPAYDKGAYSNG